MVSVYMMILMNIAELDSDQSLLWVCGSMWPKIRQSITLTLSLGQAIWVSVRTTLILQEPLSSDHSS
jgi:hypothetical protein